MADDKTGIEPEVDVDSLDDKAFEDLKGKMRAEEPPADETDGDKPDDRARDESGRFAKAEDKPAVVDDDDAEPDPKAGKSEMVPHAKFNQANERRKQAEKAKQEAEERYAKLLERTQALLEAQTPKQEAPEPPKLEIPDPKVNPVGGIEFTTNWIKDRIEAETRQRTESEAQQREEGIWQQAQAYAQHEFAKAEQSDQELRPAYDYLLKSFQAEFQAYGMQGPMLEQQLRQTEREHITYALKNNMRIPDYLKALASARGFHYAAPQPEVRADPAADIAAREEARKAALSLGKAGGGVTNTGAITPQQLLDMDDAEFAAYVAKNGGVGRAFMN